MEASVVMISSLTVNLCVLVALIVSRMLRQRRVTERRGSVPGVKEQIVEKRPLTGDTAKKSSAVTHKAMEAFAFCDVITSSFRFGAGLYIAASSPVWQCPFSCASHHDHTTSSLPTYKDQDIRYTFDETTSVLLSISLGTFIFTLFHLIFATSSSSVCSLWTVLRSGYLFVTVASISVILTTGENLLGGSLILLMEVDSSIEGICQVLDGSTPQTQVHKSRILLSAIGITTSIGTRIVTTWAMSISLGYIHSPVAMHVISLSFASFGFIFYQAYALQVVKQHKDRIQRLLRGDISTPSVTIMMDSYNGVARYPKAGRQSRKNMAFYLMNEGLGEISTYANTVAGAITGKKFFPISILPESPQKVIAKDPLVSCNMIKQQTS